MTQALPVPPAGSSAAGLPLAAVDGLVVDEGGAAFVLGSGTARRFDGVDLRPGGGSDLLLARYQGAPPAPAWVRTYGDSAEQRATGLALAGTAELAVLARVSGVVGGLRVDGPEPQDLLLVVGSGDGEVVASRALDLGPSGALRAVAGRAGLGLVAVCGAVDGTVAGGPRAVAAAGELRGGRQDAVVVLLDLDGRERWHRVLGGAGEETCDALVLDPRGDVLAAGRSSGVLDLGTGVASLGPATEALWVARLSTVDGSTRAAATFGSSGPTAATPLAVGGSGALLLSGTFTDDGAAPLELGSWELRSAGGRDAFAARLDLDSVPAFRATWAVRLGGELDDEAAWLAPGPGGVVLVAGTHRGLARTTGVAALSAGGDAPNAFLLQLRESDGALQFAASFGDEGAQTGARVAVGAGLLALGGHASASQTWFGGSVFPPVAPGPPGLRTSEAASFLAFGRLGR